jgi:hypothetical protein
MTMIERSRQGIGLGLLGAGILAGAVLISTRGAAVLGAPEAQTIAQAAALLLVEPHGAGRIAGPGDPTAESIQRDVQTQAALIRSRRILDRALAGPAIANLESVKRQKDPASWIAQHLRVEILPQTSLIRVSLAPAVGVNVKEQAGLINAVVENFLEEARDIGRAALKEERTHLAEELNRRKTLQWVLQRELQSLDKEIEAQDPMPVSREALALYSLDLRKKQLEIELERAAVEAGLEGRKGKSDPEERARLEGRIAALGAQERVLRQERGWVAKWSREPMGRRPDAAERLRDQIRRAAAAEDKAQEQMLAIEREMARGSRILLIDRAVGS